MNIVSENLTEVNRVGIFSLAEEDKALLGSNLSASASSVGERVSTPSYVPLNVPLGLSPYLSESQSAKPTVPKSFNVPLGSSFPSESECAKPNLSNQDNLAFLDDLPDGFLSEDLLNLIRRQMSAFPMTTSAVPETVQNSFGKFLENNASMSDTDKEFRIGIALAYVKAGMSDKADTFLSCGTDVAIMNCESCGYQHPVSYNCKLRICPRCSRIRALELTAKYQERLETFNPKRVRCATLTIKNVDCLESGISKIKRCFVNLLHQKYYKGRIEGGLDKVEVTVGNDGLWHVHIHCVVVGDYVKQKKLSKDWTSVTAKEFGVGSPVVWIERKETNATLKYCVKHLLKKMKINDNWTSEKLVEYEMALTNVRLVQPFGCFLGVLKDYEKKPFECPRCGESLWRITSLSGETIVSPLSRMFVEYDKIKSPSTPSLWFASDG